MRALELFVVVTTWIVAGVAAPAAPRAEATSIPSAQIRAIAFDDVASGQHLPLAELRGLIGTRVGEALDAGRLELDREALVETLIARGYLAATVATSVTTTDGVYVVFDIATGPLFRVRALSVTGPARSLEASLQDVVGEPATADRIGRVRRTITEALAGQGKIGIDLAIVSDPVDAAVDLEVSSRVTTLVRR